MILIAWVEKSLKHWASLQCLSVGIGVVVCDRSQIAQNSNRNIDGELNRNQESLGLQCPSIKTMILYWRDLQVASASSEPALKRLASWYSVVPAIRSILDRATNALKAW